MIKENLEMGKYIFLNPDGIQDIGLLVVVAAKTGVVYAHQGGGFNAEIRELEGFIVPVGDYRLATKLSKFFWQEFKGQLPVKNNTSWKEATVQKLATLVQEIPFWQTCKDGFGEDKRALLELDTEKLGDLTEAWVPVKTVYGPGVLVFKNSD